LRCALDDLYSLLRDAVRTNSPRISSCFISRSSRYEVLPRARVSLFCQVEAHWFTPRELLLQPKERGEGGADSDRAGVVSLLSGA